MGLVGSSKPLVGSPIMMAISRKINWLLKFVLFAYSFQHWLFPGYDLYVWWYVLVGRAASCFSWQQKYAPLYLIIWSLGCLWKRACKTCLFHPLSWHPFFLEKAMAPHSVLLPGKSHGRRSLEGCSPPGHWRLDATEQLHFHFSLSCIGEGNGKPLQCSCLENPRDGRNWWAAVCGVTQSRKRLKWLSSSSSCFSGEGNGNPFQYSCLENPMDGGAWWAAVRGVAKSWTRRSDFTFTFHFHVLEKEMATHSSTLAWRIPVMEESSGLPSMGSHRVRHDWSDLATRLKRLSSSSSCFSVWAPLFEYWTVWHFIIVLNLEYVLF